MTIDTMIGGEHDRKPVDLKAFAKSLSSGIVRKMHEHPKPTKITCPHELKFCEDCNVVYCEKCGRQWETPCTLPHTRTPDYEPWKRYPPKPWSEPLHPRSTWIFGHAH